jgi:UDP-3-O-[3-hydroxymyristoyl] glucosamine N-acyltransferase
MQVIFVGSNYNIRQMTDICHARGIEIAGLLDQDYWNNTQHIDHVPVVGNEHRFDWSSDYKYFIATNWMPGAEPAHKRNQQKRIDQINLLKQHDIRCINLIHPTAVVPETCTLGVGVMIGAQVVLGNHCKIGDYCQIREQSYMAHSSTLGTNVVLQVQSYVGSNVVIHDNSYVGIKASIIPKTVDPLIIPKNSFIKAHSMVTVSPG